MSKADKGKLHGVRLALRPAVAAGAVTAAFVVRQILLLRFGITLPAFVTLYPAVMLVALFLGVWNGIWATSLATLLAAIWIFEPAGDRRIPGLSDGIALALFFGVCVLICLVAERYRRNQRRVSTMEQERALRETRQKLEESSAYRQLALEAANLGAWDYDLETGQVTWDEGCRNGFGFASGEGLDYEVAIARIPDEDRPSVDAAVKAAIAGVDDGAYHQEFRVVWPDGAVHWISSHGRVYFEGDQPRAVRFMGINTDITARKRAEDELNQSKREWERTFNSLPDLIAIMDNRHRIVRVNRSMAQKLGRTPEECVGLSCFSSVHGLMAPIANCPHVLTLKDRQEHTAEVQEERLGGDFLVSTTPLIDEQGVMNGVVHVARNITDRKRAEEELKKLNRTLRAISKSNQALLHATDEPAFLAEVCRIIREDCGHALVWIGYAENDEYKTVRPVASSGFDKGYLEALGVTWGDGERGLSPAGTAIRIRQPHLCRDMLTDPAFLPWREAAGKRGYASALSIPLMEGQTALGAITIYSLEPDAFSVAEVDLLRELAADVEFGIQTLRTRAAHSRVEESLRESETRFRSVLDDSRDVIYRMNLQTGRYEYISPSAESVLGISRAELAALDLRSELARVHPDDLASVHSSMARLIETGKEELEYRMCSGKDGEYLWLSSHSSLIRDASGRPLYRDGTVRDITAKKLAEEALLRSEKLASVGRMAATISHEINNPLAAVTNLLFLAQWNQDLPESVRRNLEMADAELKRIAHITQQSLGFYRESNAPAIVRVDMVLESAIDLMKSKIKAKRGVIENKSEGNVEVNAVAGELRQVFANLLANSLDAIDDGGTVRLQVCEGPDLEDGKHSVQVIVADNGKGIGESSLQHIFEPFFTTKGAVGTGLGLWVTKQIIEKHQGTISMRSCTDGANRGTAFTVLLPALPGMAPATKSDAVLVSPM